jgi:sugar phosphate isomerase/epimerase
MFLGLSMWSFEKDAFAGRINYKEFIRYAADNGYTGVELLDCFWKESEEEINTAREIAHDAGVKIGCYSIGNDFACEEEAKRKEQAQYVQRGIETAARLGAPILRVFGGSPKEGILYEKALPWIVEGFRACTALAEKRKVNMAMENHGTLSGSWKQVEEIVKKVNSPWFGATADFGNFLLVDENPLESVKGILPLIKHVHCKDFAPTPEGELRHYRALSGKRFSGCALGDGVVGIDGILKLLKKKKCTAMISIEYEGLASAWEGVPRSKAFAEKFL